MKVVFSRQFVPIAVSVGYLQRAAELDVALAKLDEAIGRALNELVVKSGGRLSSVGVTLNSVSLGNISGILVIAYALVED